MPGKIVQLRVPFETAIIERYRRRESSVEEARVGMYLAGVSMRRAADIIEALWGKQGIPAAVSGPDRKAGIRIGDWRNRPAQDRARAPCAGY